RLMAKNVFSGLVTAWRFAGWPTSCSPSLLKATIEGVVRAPSEFSMTFGCFPSITATHELVVPRSIPITFAISYPPCGRPRGKPGPALLAPEWGWSLLIEYGPHIPDSQEWRRSAAI